MRTTVSVGLALLYVALLMFAFLSDHPVHADVNDSEDYASPLELLLSPNGMKLYVLCQQSDEVRVLDATSYAVIKNIAVGHSPRGFALSPDGKRLFVANSWDDTLTVIDTGSLAAVATWPVGSEPSSVVEDHAGKRLFVANRISNDVAVLDTQTGKEEKRLLAGRGASYLAISLDGKSIYATHIYPNASPHRTAPESEITVIDAARAVVVDRIPLHAIAGVFHVALSADGRLGVAAEMHPKNLVPLAHLEHGWAFADTLTLFGADVGQAVEVPLDELERYASRPFGVVIAPDKSRIYVSSGGSENVTVIDVQRLLNFVRAQPHSQPVSFALDLSASANYVVTRISVGHDPRGLTFSSDGRRLFVANRLDDTVSVIDTDSNRVVSTIMLTGSRANSDPRHDEITSNIVHSAFQGKVDCANCHLGDRKQNVVNPKDLENLIDAHMKLLASTITPDGSRTVSPLRRGEQTFYTSRYSFQSQIGCANCHIDSTFDGITWDLEPDGFGRDIVDNRLVEDIKGTEPFKWNGSNPNIPTECGPRTEKYFWRSENYDNRTLADLSLYVRSLPPRPNRWRRPDGKLTLAQDHGEKIFERTVDNIGQPIPVINRCSYCHSGPKGTSQKSFDVGTRKETDNTGLLDTPQLTNIALTAPYLHDGSARTLEEIWTKFNTNDKHGRTNDLSKDDLNDLVEYLKTR